MSAKCAGLPNLLCQICFTHPKFAWCGRLRESMGAFVYKKEQLCDEAHSRAIAKRAQVARIGALPGVSG
jgi:hypothetical protein